MWQNKIRVLIVDDNSNDLHFIKSAVEKGGYKTFILKRGDQVANFIKSHTVHAMIVDVMLPAKDGVSLAQEVQNEAHFKGPIFFISGIFKESDFVQRALKKTQAKGYFEKPFETESLLKELDAHLENLSMDVPATVDLCYLLSREFSSVEKKIRALEQTRYISGLDFLCILSMIMDTQCSGHINLSCSRGIFGITLYKGQLALFLSLNSVDSLKKRISKEEYLMEEEYKALTSETPFEWIHQVLSLQSMSPHTFGELLEKEIEAELQMMIKEKSIKYNFVHHSSLKYKGALFKRENLTKVIYNLIRNEISYEELKDFYTGLMDHPIHRRPEFGREQLYLRMPLVQQNKFILEALHDRPSFNEILSQKNEKKEAYVFLTIHFMALIHVIVFGGRRKITNVPFFKKNVSKIWKNIKGKDPFEVFKYLGVGENAKDFVITRQYQNYRDLNHPGLLPIDAPEEVKKLAQDSLSEVTEAFQILSNEKTKEEIKKKSLKAKEERRIQLQRMTGILIKKVEKGQFKEALEIIQQSNMEDHYEEIKLYKAWMELKLSEEGKDFYKVSSLWQKNLIVFSQNIKQKAIYHFVLGLCYRGLNQIAEARSSFSNALKLNENFSSAKVEIEKLPISLDKRREENERRLREKQKAAKSEASSDIFNMVSSLFKRG